MIDVIIERLYRCSLLPFVRVRDNLRPVRKIWAINCYHFHTLLVLPFPPCCSSQFIWMLNTPFSMHCMVNGGSSTKVETSPQTVREHERRLWRQYPPGFRQWMQQQWVTAQAPILDSGAVYLTTINWLAMVWTYTCTCSSTTWNYQKSSCAKVAIWLIWCVWSILAKGKGWYSTEYREGRMHW